MMKKIFLSVMLLAAFCVAASAQLTTGNPSAKEIRTGNRPQKGDFGLFLGYGISAGTIESWKNATGLRLPIVNLKYFASDKMELRLGLDSQVDAKWLSGKLKDAAAKSGNSESTSYFFLEPGFAYHCTKHNILDVYFGAELPIGWEGTANKSFDKVAGTKTNITSTNFVLGLRPVIGLQCFVANLPLAIGVEYGFFGFIKTGGKYKTVSETGGNKQVYYTTSSTSTTPYDSLSDGIFGIDNEVRLTFSYYFK